jgi:peptidyl-prolyl cis-trans isomerase D
MLQAIRDRVTGIVAIIILGLLAIPFVFFGLDSYIRDVPQDAVASVGDTEITASEFQTEFSRYRAQLRAQQGEAYSDIEANRPEARREFLESMIEQRLLTNYAQQMGLTISPTTIAEVIASIPAFQLNGQFDVAVYEQRIRASGQTPAGFERDLARDLLVQELPAAVSSSTPVTDADVDRWLAIQLESRSVATVRVPSAPLIDPAAVDAATVEQYYNDNLDQFMRPEQISVEFLELDTRDMAQNIEIDEQSLRERYEAVRERFMSPERRRAAHILLTDEQRSEDEARALAQTLTERLRAGESFADLAGEFSEDPVSAEDGGDLGWIEPGVMMASFEDALFAMEAGAVSDPVQTEFGWHIIRLDEVEEPRGQSFDEARAEIEAEVREERAEDMYIELSERMVDLIYADPTGLASVASDLGLELQNAGPFSRFSAEGVLANPAVMEAAFSDLVLVERQASEPIEVDPNHAVVVRVLEHFPTAPRSLDDVREEIVNRLAREQAREAARARAETLLTQIRGAGEDGIAEVAEAESLELTETQLTRRSFEVGGELLEGVFQMPLPQSTGPVYEILGTGSDWVIVRLDTVVPGDPTAADPAQRESARQQLRFSRSGLEFQGLMQWLRDNTEISVVADRL